MNSGEFAVGDGGYDQDDVRPGPAATSTSDAMLRDGRSSSMPAFRSVVSVLVSFV
jgi:hypothetical protein